MTATKFFMRFYSRTHDEVTAFVETEVLPRHGSRLVSWKVRPLVLSVNPVVGKDNLEVQFKFKGKEDYDALMADKELRAKYMALAPAGAAFVPRNPGDVAFKPVEVS